MPVIDYSPIVGKTQLDSLILRLYSNPQTIFREYIQNACDSIYDAVKAGILSSKEEGSVVININANKRCIEIEDNGLGIQQDKALSTLMDIFHSAKNGIDYAGQYGIGRLAGGGYCKELVFKTTVQGEDKETQLSMDIVLLKKILADDNDDRSAEQVMQHICSVSYNHVDITSHYMKVCMNDITNAKEILLNEEIITEYVKDIAPVDYSVPFKQLINASASPYFKEKMALIRTIHVSVNENIDLKKRYGLAIEGNGDKIKQLHFFSIPSQNYGSLAWGWYAVTPFSVQIPSSDQNAGIRLRKHNISLDKEILNFFFKEERGNMYFYGEIFIDNDNIKPNSGRQGLSSGDETEELYCGLRSYFKELSKVYSKANTIKNKLRAVKTRYTEFLSKRNTLNQTEIDIYLKYLNEDIKIFKEAIENPHYSEEIKEVCNIYLEEYNEDLFDKIKQLYAPTQETEITSDLVEESQQEDMDKVTTSQTSTNLDSNKNSGKKEETIPVQSKTTQVIQNKIDEKTAHKLPELIPTNNNVKKDAFQRLQDAGYSINDVGLARKIFGYLNILCPPANKALLEQLKEKTIDLLITNQI